MLLVRLFATQRPLWGIRGISGDPQPPVLPHELPFSEAVRKPQRCKERKACKPPCIYCGRCPPTGIASSKIEPSGSDLISLNLPPRFAIKVEEMASPNPIPPGCVVKNGSNMSSQSSAEIPGPESWTN